MQARPFHEDNHAPLESCPIFAGDLGRLVVLRWCRFVFVVVVFVKLTFKLKCLVVPLLANDRKRGMVEFR